MARASKIMAPTSCFTGQVHRLPDAPEAYGAMITRAKAAPPQSRCADLVTEKPPPCNLLNHDLACSFFHNRASALVEIKREFVICQNIPQVRIV